MEGKFGTRFHYISIIIGQGIISHFSNTELKWENFLVWNVSDI